MKEYTKDQLFWIFDQGIFIGYHEGKPDTVDDIYTLFNELIKTIPYDSWR